MENLKCRNCGKDLIWIGNLENDTYNKWSELFTQKLNALQILNYKVNADIYSNEEFETTYYNALADYAQAEFFLQSEWNDLRKKYDIDRDRDFQIIGTSIYIHGE